MLASDVLGVVRSTLIDPSPGAYWTDAELLSYLTQFINWACGLKPDLNTTRTLVTLVAGFSQTLPGDGILFLDAIHSGNGQAIHVVDMQSIKHSKFAQMAQAPQAVDTKVVVFDPRNPKGYYAFPPNTGTGQIQLLYCSIPPALTSPAASYPLDPDTVDAAYAYVCGVALAKNTDRQDLQKSGAFYARSRQWFMDRNAAQQMGDPKPNA